MVMKSDISASESGVTAVTSKFGDTDGYDKFKIEVFTKDNEGIPCLRVHDGLSEPIVSNVGSFTRGIESDIKALNEILLRLAQSDMDQANKIRRKLNL